MIRVFPSHELGKADYGWLKTKYHFSFANYYNPERMGFGPLRVINDDIIQPGAGFEPHPHRDMEIITYVTQGAITHEDSQGNQGRTQAGDIQVMTAGTGIVHSEYNHESIETKLFQIWIMPKAKRLKPSWNSHKFPKSPSNQLTLLVSGDGQAPLSINQDARIYAGNLTEGQNLVHPLEHDAYLVVIEGELELEDTALTKGDGVEITQTNQVALHAKTNSKVLIIEI